MEILLRPWVKMVYNKLLNWETEVQTMKKDTKKKNRAKPEQEEQLTVKAELYDWAKSVIFAVILCVLVFVFCVRVVTVDGNSMLPSLHSGDRLIVSNLKKDYQAGDIVVLVAPKFMSEPLVKRIIATEHQVVEINFDKGIVYVDGEALFEPYIAEPTFERQDYTDSVEVPEGCVFVMGDNRNHSSDSRTATIGCVDTRYILGEAYFVAFPVKSFGLVQTDFPYPVSAWEHPERDHINIGAGRLFDHPKPEYVEEPETSPEPAEGETVNE